ncbi:hypothetical protein MVEN_00080300 [Mycena venus]|uniref:Uncharacterized protein n=1 Tax=Mycena venus TaxID=2733690 RepID=A0A8H6Z431_9AGAR|nr:hypothetical protein MVEN_00080300 [Mycena venus]
MAHENPHTKMTRPDPAPAVLPDADKLAILFTNAQFPRIGVVYSRLTKNMQDDGVEAVGSIRNTLAVVPFGAGAEFYKNNRHANRDVEKFLHSLPYGTTGIDVAMPTAKHTPKGTFDGPYPMVLTGCSEDLAKFLVWNRTFAINDKVTFNVFMNSHSTATLYLLGAAVVPGSGKQRVVEATKSFCLTYIETDDHRGDRAPVYQLTAKPISSDPDVHLGYHAIIINKRWVDWSWCLSKMHPAHNCNLPAINGWLGLKPDNAARHAARIAKMKEKEESNSKGKGKAKGRPAAGGIPPGL